MTNSSLADDEERDDRCEIPTTFGELKLSDLPPIEDLTITVPAESLIKIGKVISIVNVLVVVESIRSMPPLDLDTVLFKSDGSPLGQVFDTFGTITEPHYSVRFADPQQIKDKEIAIDMEVFFTPNFDREITKFAFVDQLKKFKGTDASGEHDNERPTEADSDEEFN